MNIIENLIDGSVAVSLYRDDAKTTCFSKIKKRLLRCNSAQAEPKLQVVLQKYFCVWPSVADKFQSDHTTLVIVSR